MLDQKGVDGAVNGIAEITGESGGLLRYVQSGRVQRYALLLFAAVGLLEPRPATRQHLIRGESFQWTGSTTGR